jgi:SOS-response transcriptional repressor LexA
MSSRIVNGKHQQEFWTMTKTQAKLLAFIRDYIAEHGYSPMIREMAAGIGAHRETTRLALKRLHERGFITKNYRQQRSVRIIGGGPHTLAA